MAKYFYDADVAASTGDTIRYTIFQASGLSVGSWVNLNPATGVIVFSAGLANVGWNYFKVTATDNYGAFLTQPFGLLVNAAPFINENINTLYAIENIPFAVEIP